MSGNAESLLLDTLAVVQEQGQLTNKAAEELRQQISKALEASREVRAVAGGLAGDVAKQVASETKKQLDDSLKHHSVALEAVATQYKESAKVFSKKFVGWMAIGVLMLFVGAFCTGLAFSNYVDSKITEYRALKSGIETLLSQNKGAWVLTCQNTKTNRELPCAAVDPTVKYGNGKKTYYEIVKPK